MYIIKNHRGEVFVGRTRFLKRPEYAPANVVELAVKFKTKEDAEAYIGEKLNESHSVVNLETFI